MDYYTLKLFKLTYLDVDLEKSFVTHITNDKSILNIFLKTKVQACKICGCGNIKVRSTSQTKVNHSIYSDLKVELYIHRRKYFCPDCGHYFTEDNPIVSSNRNISIMTDFRILDLLKDPTNTYSKVANLTSTSITYVQNIFDKYIDIKLGKLSTVVCIDEVYAKKLVDNKYICIWYNPFERKVIDVLDSRWKSDLLICVDSFHVIKHLNDAFNQVRLRVQKRFAHLKSDSNSYYWLYKKYNKFLLRDFSNIFSGKIKVNRTGMLLDKYQIREFMLSLDDELRLAYELKEEYRSFNLSASICDAKDRLLDLMDKFKASRIKEFYPFIRTIKNWFVEIVNSFNRINGKRISNGPMERTNRTIKQLFYNGFGFTNFQRTRKRIIYISNPDTPLLGVPKHNK
ncbi:MAG: transposase [Anaeroplasmataceae bacterium]|nr:transposase [Anaeroplasmataceae bacterium]